MKNRRHILMLSSLFCLILSLNSFSEENLPVFKCQPVAGTLFGDLFVTNYVDLDPSSGLLDWDCSSYTYDGHSGHDIGIRSFAEQSIGVPVFSVLDGIVTATHDGEFDMNISAEGQPSNYVIIDHGNGITCRYIHLKKDSVIVSAGQHIKAGQQIGKVGSSGNSTAPHLHFETRHNGQVVEPYAGPCHSGKSMWNQQIPIRRDTYIWNAAVTYERYNENVHHRLFDLPRHVQIELGDDVMSFWIWVNAVPAYPVWRIKLIRPDGTIATDQTGTHSTSTFYRKAWWWYSFYNRATPDTTGIWKFVYYLNDEKMVELPFLVVETRDPNFNRPPNPVSLTFEPENPNENDVIVCRINTCLVHDDPDYDIVQYEYIWTVNNNEVRRVTSAAHSDVIPHNLISQGDKVVCTVTPNDGKVDGPTTHVSIIVQESGCNYKLIGDLDGDCKVNISDLMILASNWLINCHEEPLDPECIPK